MLLDHAVAVKGGGGHEAQAELMIFFFSSFC